MVLGGVAMCIPWWTWRFQFKLLVNDRMGKEKKRRYRLHGKGDEEV